VAIEDSETGSLSAHRAGMFTVACPTAMSQGHTFGHVDVLVETLEDVALADMAGRLASRRPL
jgi:beta-phosphoglucomutase-like phosphatase (HAD superfamily)